MEAGGGMDADKEYSSVGGREGTVTFYIKMRK